MNWKEKMEELQAPFNWSDIKFRIGTQNSEKTKAIALAYVSNRAIQDRLDKVVGICGWKNEYKPWGDGAQICGISIYNDEIGEWVTKWDGAENTRIESVKGGLSDSMKRAAGQWGIGRYLYRLKTEWCEIENKYGNVYDFKKRPVLPKWAYAQGELSPIHIQVLDKIARKKGLNEELICNRLMKDEYSELTIAEMKKVVEKLEKAYEDVKPGEEPRAKEKLV